MQWLLSGSFIMRSSQCFPVDRHGFAIQAKLKMLNPRGQTLLQLLGIENAEDSGKRIVRRHAVRQLQKFFKPCQMTSRKAFNIRPRICPADCAAKHEPHHVEQGMIFPAVSARVFEIDKICKKFKVSIRSHRRDSVPIHKKRAKQFCHLTGNHFTQYSDRKTRTRRAIALPQAGLWFGKTDDLWSFGRPSGWGAVWWDTDVEPGTVSAPFLMTGFHKKTLPLKNESDVVASVEIEVDFLGDGSWSRLKQIDIPAGGYVPEVFPDGYSAHWVRVRSQSTFKATAMFIYR
jgi:hypothetical protein